jgi:hypothetical protein
MILPRGYGGIGIREYRNCTHEHNEEEKCRKEEKDWKGKVFHFLRSYTGYGVPPHSFLK